uniref:Uncharacterized protein n=1 Tax=Sphaeramia orbicularis TaxID=375764 RepID=A0A672Y3U3_9TELE
MAEKPILENFLTCPVCLETFRDPVSLSCNHSFCLICLKEFWKEKENRTCPVCRRKNSKETTVNFALKELAESFAGSLKVGSSETEKGEKKVEVVCSKHPEEPKLFCKDENRAVCLMRDKVHFSPVILDPNTAHGWLHLSDDLTSVRYGDTYQQVPDNPERNNHYASVHGCEGFTSGKHSWDVEVGDHLRWTLGLVKESVNRKGELLASPEYGIWCLKHNSGKYTNGLGQTMKVQTSPQRVRVELDYNRGQVSFYNAEDKTQIYTHRDTFTEKLYPYFCVSDVSSIYIEKVFINPIKNKIHVSVQ